MAHYETRGIPRRDGNGRAAIPRMSQDHSVGELLKRLAADSGDLIQKEMALAKVELRDTSSTLARDGAKIGVAASVAWTGMLALTAFAIIGIGDLVDSYMLGALIVGVVLVAVGWVLLRSALKDVREHGLKPEETLESLRRDAEWSKTEANEFKHKATR